MNEDEKKAAAYILAEIAGGRLLATSYEAFMSGVRHRVEVVGKWLENVETERRVFAEKEVTLGFKNE